MRYAAAVCASVILMVGLAGCGPAGGGEPGDTKEAKESPTESDAEAKSEAGADSEDSEEESGSDGEVLPSQPEGDGTPEVTMSLNGSPVPLAMDEIKCSVSSVRISYTFAKPHEQTGGLGMTLKPDPLSVDSLVFSSDDVLLGPFFGSDAEVFQATVSGDAVVVTGTVENRYGEQESLDLRVEAACKT